MGKGTKVDINKMINTLKGRHDSNQIGMIATHLGVVRGTSRNGQEVTGIEVSYDHDLLREIIEDIKRMPGIVDVLVETEEGRLRVGDEILSVAVAGDIREHVFAALMDAVNRIKAEASGKKEFFGQTQQRE